MNTVSAARFSGLAKVMFFAAAVMAAIRVVDFIFYGWAPRDLLAAVGFALLAYGMYVNGLDKVGRSKGGNYATVVGSVLVIVAIGLKYWG